jgi:hypothetical protein
MAEPLSTAASVVAVIDVATKLSFHIWHLVRDWKEAPRHILALANELDTLQVVVK